ncbi:hypothetical protein DXM27_05085 [Rhizobium rhizogenes]|uniref:Uncharacterized protein n=1 Tax=Rhizobium rhizogenes TaxID=359 RepID=A0AA88F875_RHIRH|nr:hypothetical protein [Rhizobium rhizogenes]KAA3504589.1 hypothetical protein DXM27_05085 [Rhizobium rhizogenes]
MSDIADDNWAERDDRNAENAPDGFPPGLPAQIETIGRMMMGAIKRFWNKSNPVYQTSGMGDDYVVTPEGKTIFIHLYEVIRVRLNSTNTTDAPTFKFGDTNPRVIKKVGPSGVVALLPGDMLAGQDHSLWYDGTNYILSNPATVDSASVVGVLKTANNLSELTATAATARNNIGIGNVDNTSDANKPVSIAQDNAISSAYSASTSYTDAAAATRLPLAGGTMTGAINMDGFSVTDPQIDGAPRGKLLSGYISPGFNLANNASDATNDIDFPAGSVASDNANPILMTHAAATVQLDVAYGTGSGGRFDSAISDGWWHCFIISNGTTVSRGFSKSLNPTSQPNWPAGYTNYRRVASWPRVGGTLLAITQREDDFMRVTEVQDRNSLAAYGPASLVVSAPLGIVTQPKMRQIQEMGTTGNIQTSVTSANKTGGWDFVVVTTAAGNADGMSVMSGVYTDTSSQIRLQVVASGGSGSLSTWVLLNEGWIDNRGKS